MKTIVVDTNAFLRFFLGDIPEQKKTCEKLLLEAKNHNITLIVPQVVLFEMNYVLEKLYHVKKNEVVGNLSYLINTDYLEVESKGAFLSALKMYSNNSLSLADCLIACIAQARNAEVFTFDKKLAKATSH